MSNLKKTVAALIETDPVDHKTNQWVLQALSRAQQDALADLHTKQDRATCQGFHCRSATPRSIGWTIDYEEVRWNSTALVDVGDQVFFVCEDCFDFLTPKPVEPYVPPTWVD